MSRYRKAFAAFIVPFLSLPLAGWVSGEVDFAPSVLIASIISGAAAVATYWFPNEPAA